MNICASAGLGYFFRESVPGKKIRHIPKQAKDEPADSLVRASAFTKTRDPRDHPWRMGTAVDRFGIVSEHHDFVGIQFWFDALRITDPARARPPR